MAGTDVKTGMTTADKDKSQNTLLVNFKGGQCPLSHLLR